MGDDKRIITDKEFYKAMQKLKERGNSAVPPKKSASAYIIFGKEVSSAIINLLEKGRNFKEKPFGKSDRSCAGDC